MPRYEFWLSYRLPSPYQCPASYVHEPTTVVVQEPAPTTVVVREPAPTTLAVVREPALAKVVITEPTPTKVIISEPTPTAQFVIEQTPTKLILPHHPHHEVVVHEPAPTTVVVRELAPTTQLIALESPHHRVFTMEDILDHVFRQGYIDARYRPFARWEYGDGYRVSVSQPVEVLFNQGIGRTREGALQLVIGKLGSVFRSKL